MIKSGIIFKTVIKNIIYGIIIAILWVVFLPIAIFDLIFTSD